VQGLYLIPGWMTRREGGTAELARRRAAVQRVAGPGWTMDAWEVVGGPASIESAYEEYQSVPGAIDRLVEAERTGFAGAILGCFGDPGIEAAREMVSMPVVGPGEASMLLAASLGHRFSIVTVLDSLNYLLERPGRSALSASWRQCGPSGFPSSSWAANRRRHSPVWSGRASSRGIRIALTSSSWGACRWRSKTGRPTWRRSLAFP